MARRQQRASSLAPRHDRCQTELVSLEKDPKTGIIDHPPNGSKDCADALAGVCYGLTMRREVWAAHNVVFQAFWERIKAVVKNEPEVQEAEHGEGQDTPIAI